MEFREVIKWLLDNGYGVMMGTQFVQTEKLNNELVGRTTVTVQAVTRAPTTTVDLKDLWNAFIRQAEIPHRVNSSIGVYTVRQYNIAAAKALQKIVADPAINYTKFVEATKNYYKTVSGKLTLSKYLLNDVWKDEYQNHEKIKKQTDGSSMFED